MGRGWQATTDDGAPLAVVPANQASCDDLLVVLAGANCHGHRCYCQRFKRPGRAWEGLADDGGFLLRQQADCGQPKSGTTSGLVAYLDGEPAGWCAVEPRPAYTQLRTSRVVWPGRSEDKDDPTVWAAACFVTRAGFRRRGVSRALARAAVEFARSRGARALEGYPIVTEPGQEVVWGELHVGSRSIFAQAGLREVSRPTGRRAVMRIDF